MDPALQIQYVLIDKTPCIFGVISISNKIMKIWETESNIFLEIYDPI